MAGGRQTARVRERKRGPGDHRKANDRKVVLE